MKAKKNILKILIGTTLLLAILIPVKSNAALQANGNSVSKARVDYWLPAIRKMESEGETLGLIGSASLTQTLDENANNLDIHMQKNTEYGAMAILSASNYGKSTPIQDTTEESLSTTTGNKSGIYINLNNLEWVAAGGLSYVGAFNTAKLKYKNIYDYQKENGKIGDALFETAGWHKTNNPVYHEWKGRPPSGISRGYGKGSIFSYDATDYIGGNYAPPAYASRAVVVVGERILKIVSYKNYT